MNRVTFNIEVSVPGDSSVGIPQSFGKFTVIWEGSSPTEEEDFLRGIVEFYQDFYDTEHIKVFKELEQVYPRPTKQKVWRVSISDSYCEWVYHLDIPKSESTQSVAQALASHFNCPLPKPVRREDW